MEPAAIIGTVIRTMIRILVGPMTEAIGQRASSPRQRTIKHNSAPAPISA